MKTLKILTIIAITGTVGIMAQGAGQEGQGNCTNQYNITIGDQASNRKMQRRKNPNRRINRLLHKLDLSEAQKTKLGEIRKQMQQARKIQQKKLRGSMNLKKFVSVDGFDKEEFVAATEGRAKEMANVRADMMEKFITVLTPEQRIELVEKLNKQSHRRGKGKRHQQQ